MDIHRCRFVPYAPSSINAVAFSHSSLPTALAAKPQQLKYVQVRLAIGRANGDIEIWNPLGGLWHQELVIPGGNGRSVDGLVWITDADEEMSNGKTILGRSRLFSIGYTSAVTEWDLEKAKPKKHASGQHGDIWCLGAQPPVLGKNGVVVPSVRKLVAGTVDGNLVLYSTEDNDLKFVKSLVRTPSKSTKIVSIAFQTRNIVVVGCSNSTIGVYDIRNGSLLRQMALGAGISGGPKNIIVWSVKCLPKGDIVSGDSTGHVCIWDGKTYTQVQRMETHKQDVLCLAVSADGSQIASGGMDRRTVHYEPKAGQAGRWAPLFHRRYHTHDVKAMASFEGKGMSVVVSGGLDTSPVVYPFRRAGKEYHRTLSHLPQQLNIQSAPNARLIASWWGNEIHIWHLLYSGRKLIDGETYGADIRKNRKLVAQIQVKGESNITSAEISPDGTLLLASTATEVKAFQIHYDGKRHVNITKVEVPGASNGATKIGISPDTRWALWIEEGTKVMMARVTTTESDAGPVHTISRPRKLRRLRRDIPKHLVLGGLGSYDRKISQVAFSPDGKMVSVADLAGYIDTWVLRAPGEMQNGTGDVADDDKSDVSSEDSSEDSSDDSEDNGPERWYPNPKGKLLPKLDTAPVALSFSPGHQEDGDYNLLTVTASKDVFVFNPLRGALSDWSRRNPSSKLPEQLRITRDLVKGIVWQGSRVWLYGSSFLSLIDLSQDLPEPVDTRKDGSKKGIKRKRHGQDTGAGGKMIKEHSHGPQQVTISTGPDGGESVDVDMDDQKSVGASSAYEDDDYDTDGGELQRLRDDQTTNGDEAEKAVPKPKTWNTYQYRPILGIVPLVSKPSKGKKSKAKKDGAVETLPYLEVALFERPTWDLDLPARYLADGEWER